MNSTLENFGYPDTLIQSYSHWSILLRPQQVTAGSLILGAHSKATQFSELSASAFTELHEIIPNIERALTRCFNYDKINYLMLMMVDPHVHFHVIPRYADSKELYGTKFVDQGWPGPPTLSTDTILSGEQRGELLRLIRAELEI